jgi:hypothetical protein
MGDCGCGVSAGYGPVVSDPYLSSETVVPGTVVPYDGQVVGEPIIGDTVVPGTVRPLQPDQFEARKYDSDGNRILWEEALPPSSNAS